MQSEGNNECFQEGKFTFEPEFKPINQTGKASNAEYIDNGLMSFGAAGGVL